MRHASEDWRRKARGLAFASKRALRRASAKVTRLARSLVHPNRQDPPTEEAWFARMPHVSSALVFLGDSLTAGGRWNELFANTLNILNRGIPGNTSRDLLDRLDEVTARKPRAIVLMIGTNDLIRGVSVAEVVENVDTLLGRVREACPGARVIMQGVLPIREDEIYEAEAFNAHARELNGKLREIASSRSAVWLDFHERFLDGERQLRREFTYDGVHFTPEAYLVWADELRATLMTSEAREPSHE
jgi:lysophospholipase L1-like esterase